jgi:hypothetical protein
MRDFRDAKAMATSLRQALSDRSVTVTRSDSLELISRAFGFDNWNILAAKIEAERPSGPEPAPASATLHCSFCGKHQQEVLCLIAGPAAHICNECVGLCEGVLVDKQLGQDIADARARRPDAPALEAAAEALGAYADSQLEATRRSCEDWLEHIDWSLGQVARALRREASVVWKPDEVALKRGWTRDPLKGKSRDEILAQRTHLEERRSEVSERLTLLGEILAARAAQPNVSA